MRQVVLALLTFVLLSSCKQNNATASASGTDTGTAKKEIAEAEEAMFNSIKDNDPHFWNGVSDSYISINADGVMANKDETIKDSTRRKMFIGIGHKLFDHNVRAFGDVGVCTGRAQFFMQSQMVAEVYYTAIFRKDNGVWRYEGWQGTLTKNSPKQPG
jgi:hypothetical protein